MLQATAYPLILASASKSRSALLQQAGLAFTTIKPKVDEDAVKQQLQAEQASAASIAAALAELKAMQVSIMQPDAYVIGADQMLFCEGRYFNKPPTAIIVKQQLQYLRGKTHTLPTAVCVCRGGKILWQTVESPTLTMRDFSDAFLTAYLEKAGAAIFQTVGGYQLEALGIQLMTKIQGDHSTILGLPMLPLLQYLRDCQMVQA